MALIETLIGRVPHDRPSDPMAALFLLVEAAVKTCGRRAQRGVQEVEDLEDKMFEHRRQQQLQRLALLRRRLALLHRAVLPYAEATDGSSSSSWRYATTESYSALVATEQRSMIDKLTVVASIFLPLTFVTRFFGMNFAYLFRAVQGPAAFWLLGVGLQVASLAVALYLVDRMGLWRILRGDGDVSGNRRSRT